MGYSRPIWHHLGPHNLNKVQIHLKQWGIWAEFSAFSKMPSEGMTGYAQMVWAVIILFPAVEVSQIVCKLDW